MAGCGSIAERQQTLREPVKVCSYAIQTQLDADCSSERIVVVFSFTKV